MFLLLAHHFHTVRSAAQTPISHKGIFRVLPIFCTHFSHVISQITFRTFAFRISQITHSPKITLMKALVWPVVMYGCESWTLRKNEETRLAAFQMKGLRKVLRVSWTAKKTNEWVLNKAGVKR